MKHILVLLIIITMLSSLVACTTQMNPALNADNSNNFNNSNNEEGPIKTMQTDKAKIDGVFVDKSYKDSDGKPFKMVYVFITFSKTDTNFQIDSNYTKLKIGSNEYSSEFYKGTCDYMPNYYYSSFIEEIYVGSECNIALTFKIPEADLSSGKQITLSDYDMPVSGLCFFTNDLKWCNNAQEIGQLVDPAGYQEVASKKEIASATTRDKVRAAMNGYYWEFYVSIGSSLVKYELEFFEPNKFEIRTPYLTNSGTYEVRNGYIFLYYTTSNTPVEIPYELKNGDVYLSCAEAFSIYE